MILLERALPPDAVQVDPQRQPGLNIAQVFLLHAHFSYVSDPLLIETPKDSEAQFQVTVSHALLEKGNGDEAASVSVRIATSDANSHPYIIDVAITAIIEPRKGEENYPAVEYARTAGATLLFPFVREAIANITGRGRWGPLWIRPFNVQLAEAGRVQAKT